MYIIGSWFDKCPFSFQPIRIPTSKDGEEHFDSLGSLAFVVEYGWLLIMIYSAVVVAEWLRRWTRNPLGSSRAGSNPADNGYILFLSVLIIDGNVL